MRATLLLDVNSHIYPVVDLVHAKMSLWSASVPFEMSIFALPVPTKFKKMQHTIKKKTNKKNLISHSFEIHVSNYDIMI